MGKVHPGEYEKQRDKTELELKENKMAGSEDLLTIMKEVEERTNEGRGLLAPPLTEDERRAKRLTGVHLRMLEQWRLIRWLLEQSVLQNIIDTLTQNVELDRDVKQALAIELYALVIKPTMESFGLMRAANEAVYKEFAELGAKTEKPETPTLDAILKEIQKRVSAVTEQKKGKIKKEIAEA